MVCYGTTFDRHVGCCASPHASIMDGMGGIMGAFLVCLLVDTSFARSSCGSRRTNCTSSFARAARVIGSITARVRSVMEPCVMPVSSVVANRRLCVLVACEAHNICDVEHTGVSVCCPY